MRLNTIFIIICLSLTSCMVGPDFHTPLSDVPGSWEASRPPASDKNNVRQWWTIFGDSQLNKLLEQALINNPDMSMALMRVWEARSSAKIAGAALLPSAGASTGASRHSEGGLSNSSASNFSLGADVSWDLDIFGGNKRNVEAALANLLSTEANAVAVRTLLLANVATTYFNWITANEQLRVANEQLALQKRSLKIIQDKQGAFSTTYDLEQAKAQVAATEGTIPLIKANMESAKNSLSVLLGSYSVRTTLTMPAISVFRKTPTVPVGMPSDLLRRRPDVIASEADLHVAVANIGVAVADLYPKFSLTGSVSSGARSFSDLFLNHSSRWNIGAGLTQPLYQGGKLRERVRQQEVVAERMAESYRKTLITAVSEVEEALILYASSVDRLAKMEQQNESNRIALDLSEKLYQGEMLEYINVISAQRSLLSSEESLVTLRQTIRKSIVQLALALGGGW